MSYTCTLLVTQTCWINTAAKTSSPHRNSNTSSLQVHNTHWQEHNTVAQTQLWTHQLWTNTRQQLSFLHRLRSEHNEHSIPPETPYPTQPHMEECHRPIWADLPASSSWSHSAASSCHCAVRPPTVSASPCSCPQPACTSSAGPRTPLCAAPSGSRSPSPETSTWPVVTDGWCSGQC